MARLLDREKIKIVIEALRNKPMKWSELLEQTKIPEKSLHRILTEYLSFWGLVKKDELGRWSWYDNIRTYKSERDYELALNHSKMLIPGLRAILAEDMDLYLHLGSSAYVELHKHDEEESELLKSFAEEHLRTGYSEIYEDLVKFRENMEQVELIEMEIEKEIKKIREEKPYLFPALPARLINVVSMHGYEEYLKLMPQKIVEKAKNIQEKRFESYRKMIENIFFIEMKIKMGDPLKGRCDLCPRIRIIE